MRQGIQISGEKSESVLGNLDLWLVIFNDKINILLKMQINVFSCRSSHGTKTALDDTHLAIFVLFREQHLTTDIWLVPFFTEQTHTVLAYERFLAVGVRRTLKLVYFVLILAGPVDVKLDLKSRRAENEDKSQMHVSLKAGMGIDFEKK